ncbi:MAG: hypothetical protein ACJ758_03110 [Actinomycetota bacterium]
MDRRSRLVVGLSVVALLSGALLASAASAHAHTFKTNLTIHYDKKTDTFDGHAGTASACQEGRTVHVFKSSGGGNVPVGSATTVHAGHWNGVHSAGPGSYFATVDQSTAGGYGGDTTCLSGTSKTTTV